MLRQGLSNILEIDLILIELQVLVNHRHHDLNKTRIIDFKKEIPSIKDMTKVIAEEARKHGEPAKKWGGKKTMELIKEEKRILENLKRAKRGSKTQWPGPLSQTKS